MTFYQKKKDIFWWLLLLCNWRKIITVKKDTDFLRPKPVRFFKKKWLCNELPECNSFRKKKEVKSPNVSCLEIIPINTIALPCSRKNKKTKSLMKFWNIVLCSFLKYQNMYQRFEKLSSPFTEKKKLSSYARGMWVY